MNGNQLYANGRIAVLSTKLFATDKYTRLAECSTLAEAIKVLVENGYGNGVTVSNPNDYEEILKAEQDAATALLNELCMDVNARNYFLCKYDYVNAKLLMKSKYMRIDGVSYCFGGGLYDPAKMQEAFVNDVYAEFSRNMATACDQIDGDFANGKRSPQVIDYHLDRAMYSDMYLYAKKSSYRLLRGMYKYLADTTNLMTTYRLKKANVSSSELDKWFVDKGEISKEAILKLWDSDQASADLPAQYKPFYELCKTDNPSLIEAEQAQSAALLKMLCDNVDLLSVQPVLEYFVRKTNEIDKIRKILLAVKSGVEKEKIKELLK